MHQVLSVKDLVVRFKTIDGDVTVVNGVSFGLKRGEIMGLVGESGCGKSITSLSVIGLLPQAADVVGGEINFEGIPLHSLRREDLRKLRGSRMSMIFQEPLTSLNPLLTVGEQIRETIALHKPDSPKEIKKRCFEMLAKVGIPNPEKVYENYPHLLSGGMRQRVMISIALACTPSLLIADEPTTALDVTIQAQILNLMRTLVRESDTSILLITHDLGVIAEMADRVAVMYAGQLVEESDVFTLFENPRHPYTQALLKSTIKIQDTNDELVTIPGLVPNFKKMPSGCRFAPRCSLAQGRCLVECPELLEHKGSRVACFHAYQSRAMEG